MSSGDNYVLHRGYGEKGGRRCSTTLLRTIED